MQILCIFIILTIGIGALARLPPVPKGCKKCYHIPSFYKANWHKAIAYCHSVGMKSISISSAQEHNDIVQFIQNAGYGASSNANSFWTSGTRLGNANQYYWLGNGNVLGSYTNWNSGQPDNLAGTQACIQLHSPFGFKWDDYFCDRLLNIICEKPCCCKDDCDKCCC